MRMNQTKKEVIHINVENIVQYLPEILLYIIPGFIFTAIFRFFVNMELNGLFLWVESAAISFASLSLLRMVTGEGVSVWLLCTIDIVLCILTALLAAKGYKSKRFETFCGKYFRISGRDSVLHASVDWRDGSTARIRLKNDTDIYEGYVLFISNPESPQQWICLDNPIRLNKNEERIWPVEGQSGSVGHRMTFPLGDIHSIDFV